MQTSHWHEPRWHAALFVVAAIVLYVTLPNRVTFWPLWLMPLLCSLTLLPLLISSPKRREETRLQRYLSMALIATLNVFNIATLVELLLALFSTKRAFVSIDLLVAAVQIWLTNIIVYGLWFWETDGGGPARRAHAAIGLGGARRYDFLFPQMTLPAEVQAQMKWRTQVFDYIFVAFTNATAFSPTDTFPLTLRAKMLMMLESFTSLVTIAIIAARGVGIST